MTVSVVRGTLLLGRLRLAIARNSLWRSGWARRILVVVGALLLLAGVYGVFWVSSSLVAVLRSETVARALDEAQRQGAQGLPADPQALLASLPGLLFFFAMTLLLFTSFGALLSSLYLSGDMDLLLAAPLPMRSVFAVKFFEALLPQYGLLLGLICPALYGYGWSMGYGPAFFFAAPLLLLLSPLLPASLAAVLVMAVVRVLPARRARDIVGILGGLVGASFYIANQFAPELAARFGGIDALTRLLGLNVPLLPSAWAGEALSAAGEGRYGAALGLGLLFALLALGLFAGCLLLTERLYYGGWSNLAVSGERVRRANTAARRGQLRLPRWLSPPVRAVLLKDLRVFPRDLRRLQQLIFPLALAGIWIFRLLSEPLGNDPLSRDLGNLGGVALSFFICLSASNSLAGTGISAEGRSFWLLRLAPISSRELLWWWR
jgi:ABC-2 type transport system permease protein